MDIVSRGDSVILMRSRFDEATQTSVKERIGTLSRRQPVLPPALAARLDAAEQAEVKAFFDRERDIVAKQDEVAALTLMETVTRAARHLSVEQDDAARYRLQASFREAARVLSFAASPKARPGS